jgi:hypothetical protein
MSQPPQPPYNGQPSSGQPYSGQPNSGQPQYGQPQYPGQPNSGQPQYGQPQYPGQPNPDVPTSVPPQPPSYPPTQSYPASGQPDYGQQPPPFGQQPPQFGQPEYGQQPPPGQYGQPEYGQQPGFPPPTPPKKKSKVLPIVLTSVAIVLVLCIGGVVGLYMIGKNKVDDVNDRLADATAAPTAPATGQATTDPTDPPKAASTVKIAEPTTLGGRPKLTDPQFADVAKELKNSLGSVPTATNSVGSLYGTVEKQDIVILAAAEAPIDNPKKELDQTFLGAGIGGLKVSNISDAPVGSLGGSAKCGSAETSGIDMAICAWADEGSLGMFIWYFKSVSKAKAEFPKLRAQVEKKS